VGQNKFDLSGFYSVSASAATVTQNSCVKSRRTLA